MPDEIDCIRCLMNVLVALIEQSQLDPHDLPCSTVDFAARLLQKCRQTLPVYNLDRLSVDTGETQR